MEKNNKSKDLANSEESLISAEESKFHFSFFFLLNKMNDYLRVRSKTKFGISDDAEDEMLNYQELFHRSTIRTSYTQTKTKTSTIK